MYSPDRHKISMQAEMIAGWKKMKAENQHYKKTAPSSDDKKSMLMNIWII